MSKTGPTGTGRRLLVILAVSEFFTSPAAFGQAPATRGAATPVAGWKAAGDPFDLKSKPRLDLSLTVPVKHEASAARSPSGSPFVAVGDVS
jgi:hypothetical protein